MTRPDNKPERRKIERTELKHQSLVRVITKKGWKQNGRLHDAAVCGIGIRQIANLQVKKNDIITVLITVPINNSNVVKVHRREGVVCHVTRGTVGVNISDE